MDNTPWKHQFSHSYQRVRQIPLARNLPQAQWIFLAMENHLITSEEYLPWAQKYYGLAVLNSSFFESHFSAKIYQKYKDSSPAWGPQALPLYEWDEVLFVGCLDPHAVPSNLETNCRPLLVSYENLTKAWTIASQNQPTLADTQQVSNLTQEMVLEEKLIPSVIVPPPQKPPSAMPPTPAMMPPPPPPSVVAASIIPSMTPPPPPPPAIALTPPLMTIETPPSPMPESLPPVMESLPPVEQNLFELKDIPESLPLAPTEELKDNFEMPEGLTFGNDNLEENKASSSPELEKTEENSFLEAFSSPPPLQPLTEAPPPLQSVQPETMELEEELKTSFARAYHNYRNLMILKLQGDKLYPFRWDPSYTTPNTPEAIPLDKPSMFRIAAKTGKAFHGAIAPNGINDQFLLHWFEGHQPKHITIIPLFFEKNCVGLLLGASDDPLDRKDSLQLMESTAQRVQTNFGTKLAS